MSTNIQRKTNYRIGIISDTHGLLRPEAANALQGSDLIIHSGDIGNLQIIDELKKISPVFAVRGNMDDESWAFKLKPVEVVEISGNTLYILHDVSRLDIDPSSANIRAVIHGHSHNPSIQEYDGVLYINPGSAGPRRSKRPVTVAVLNIFSEKLSAEIVKLKV